MCGEKLKFGTNVTKNPGSPPRVRGKEAPGRLCSDGRGITPAYAGKSFPTGCNSSLAQDHPRVCGEKITPLLFLALASGSPPRVRGKEDTAGSLDAVRGITPACAGKSGAPVGRLAVVRDHPRVCGEKRVATSATGTGTGSPPRVRGKVPKRSAPAGAAGITPACAGKRIWFLDNSILARDHPRVCGEKKKVQKSQ